MTTKEKKERLDNIKEIVQEYTDQTECAVFLAIKGYVVSHAEGRRLFTQLKDKGGTT